MTIFIIGKFILFIGNCSIPKNHNVMGVVVNTDILLGLEEEMTECTESYVWIVFRTVYRICTHGEKR